MGKSLQDLGLKDEQLPAASEDITALPDFGGFKEPPQPGTYRFQLPDDLSHIWDLYDTPSKQPPQRIRALFDKDHPLVIVQSQGGRYNGEPFETRLSNEERSRGKGGAIIASDMDYLLRALGVKEKPWVKLPSGQTGPNNRAYISLLQQQAKKQFSANLRFSWKCDTRRNIRVKDGNGALTELEQKGCGQAYYPEDLPNGGKQADGQVPTQIQCATCGAVLRAFCNLDAIRA